LTAERTKLPRFIRAILDAVILSEVAPQQLSSVSGWIPRKEGKTECSVERLLDMLEEADEEVVLGHPAATAAFQLPSSESGRLFADRE
jgi:hypothetical protein